MLSVGMIFANAGLLGVHSYKIQQFGDLEHDYINPTDFASGLNNMWWWECGLQGIHTVLSFVSMARHLLHIQLLKFSINLLYVGYLAYRTSTGTHKVDASTVFKGEFANKMKGKYLAGLGLVSVCFLLNLLALRLAMGDENDH
eukprot:CAMPEP_0196729062 /NCGR_PEP_ID=MMETSP1091-20130531/9554_1 /TAXON_ID=302021 /ORGANISM="Rhodomonas sp., Strain CCMP768" /LENGTH=142 /DNA_ID=CAMNT_0042071891 /DNA_START=118 /DNA_END=546 /DNA_ORIENTATION=+